MTTRILTATLVLCCSVLLGAQATDDLFVNDARPMAAMAEKIEQQTGWTITYEDPSYQFAADIEERPEEDAFGKRTRIMRGFPFVFTLDAETRKDAVRTVRALADQFELRTGGVKFRVIAEKGYIHLVPQLNRDKGGMLAAQRPALDTRISLPAGKRSLMDFMIEFTEVLSQASGRQIDIGTMALNLMLNTQVELPAFKNVQARDVLREVFILSQPLLDPPSTPQSARRKLSWQLFGGVGDDTHQALSVHPVGARRLPTE